MTEKKIKILSVVMSVVAVVIVVALVIGAVFVGRSIFTRKRGSISYNDIVYERPDFNSIDEAFEKAIDEAKYGSSSSAISAMNDATSKLNELAAYLGYANIEYQKDYTNKEWENEYTVLSAQYSKSYLDYYTMLYSALHGPNSTAIFRGWSQSDLDAIDSEYEALTGSGNYVENQQKITELQNEYNNLGNGSGGNVFASESSAREYSDKAGDLLIRMAKLYNEIYPDGSYPEYAYSSYGRTYTPSDVTKMRDYVKNIGHYAADLYYDLGESGMKMSGTSFYKEENGQVVDDARAAEKFFEKAQNVALKMFSVIDGKDATDPVSSSMRGYLTDAFDYMNDYDLYYASRNKNGNTGAFTTYLSGFEIPYMFQYRGDTINDITTFVHEFGHFTSYYLSGSFGGSDLDIAEVQSQGLEMMFVNYYEDVYGDLTISYEGDSYTGAALAEIMAEAQVQSVLLSSVVFGCIMDELQYDVYTNTDNYTRGSDVTEKYDELLLEYGLTEQYTLDYSHLLGWNYNYLEYWWSNVSHTFSQPFYYISYAMSAIPALSLYAESTEDFASAAVKYNIVQYYGNGNSGYTFEEILDKAGIGSPFEKSTYDEISVVLDSFL